MMSTPDDEQPIAPQHLRNVGGRDSLIPKAARLIGIGIVDPTWS